MIQVSVGHQQVIDLAGSNMGHLKTFGEHSYSQTCIDQ